MKFDLGRSDPWNAGLATFKDHLGATRSALNYWTVPSRRQENNRDWTRRGAKVLVASSPKWFLIMAGALLYRHIG